MYNLNDCTPTFLFEIADIVKIAPLFHECRLFGHAGRELAFVHSGCIVNGNALEHMRLYLPWHMTTLAQFVEKGLVHNYELAAVCHEDELSATGELV